MSANPANPNLSAPVELNAQPKAAEFPSSAIAAPGHEALQALLAFSSLHEQIRRRQKYAGFTEGQDPWKFEQFVLDEVLQLVAERALAITGSDGVAIALAEGDAIICRASTGEIAPDAGARLDPHSGFSGVCFRTGKIVRCDDVESDPRVNVPAARRLGVRSMVAVPLAGQRGNIGLIEAFSHDAFGFNDSDIRNLNLLAELILAAMKPEEENRLAEISQKVVNKASEAKAPENHLPSIEELRGELRPAVTAEAGHAEISEPEHVPFAVEDTAPSEKNRSGLKLVVALMVMAVALGTGLWWKLTSSPSEVKVQNPVPASTKAPQVAAPKDASATAEPSLVPDANQSEIRKDGLTLVTGVRHWSSPDSTTVVVDLHNQVQYETHRLSDPDRIYFDLHNTVLAPGLFGKSFEIGDSFLARVRIAQPMKGVTRVVLETKSDQDVPVASMQSNPYRLVVEIKKPGAAPQPKAKVDLFAPINPAPVEQHAAQTRTTPAPAVKQRQQPEPAKLRAQTHAPTFRIALDAGHGGWDKGTVGRRGLMEKDLALDIVERLSDMLTKRLGADVVLTRRDDTYIALEKRAEIANVAQADLFVSVHANYSDMPSARGVETYYTNTYSSLNARTPGSDANMQNINWTGVDIRHKTIQSQQLAASLQGALYGKLAPGQAEFQNRGVRKASYVVLTGTAMPAALAEVSFVSSPTDEKNLKNPAYRQRIAEALFKGISRYAASLHRVTMASAAGKPSGR